MRADGNVLVFERSDRPGSWQMPQGGLDMGEEPLAGALRELKEETGIEGSMVSLLGEHPEWLAYEWPAHLRDGRTDGRRGQVQKWFAFRASPELHVDLTHSDEFRAHRYTSREALADGVHEMRRGVYRQLVPWLASLGASTG